MGQVAAELFAQEGASVVVTDLNVQAGEETVQRIRQAGGTAIFIQANVAKEDEVKTLVQGAIDAFGRVDILYNNAGIMPTEDTSVIETSEATWDKVLDVNLKSAFLCSKYVIPHMIEQQRGLPGLHRAPGCLHSLERRHALVNQIACCAIWTIQYTL
jgi:NAD(P)-dependent dehydrogenase (short-subunit alcohol dehydrogenase family)